MISDIASSPLQDLEGDIDDVGNAESIGDEDDSCDNTLSEYDDCFNQDVTCEDDDNDDQEERQPLQEETSQPEEEQMLYNGANLTLASSILLILNFTLRFSLTGEGLCQLLNLICMHCPSDCKLPLNKRQFWQWFEDFKQPLVFHKYCSKCHLVLSENDLQNRICGNQLCSSDISDSSVSYFIEVPITKQIQNLFSRKTFKDDICHRFRRNKRVEQNIEDIYDGRIYQSLSKDGAPLQNENNLSLLWNTDGVPCFKSSNMSLWPLFFQVNELPYSKRKEPDYMILGGLWFGPQKPSVLSFTEPFLKSLKPLETDGVIIQSPDGTVSKTCVFVICGTADLPARSLMCNTVQYNGKYGCCKCLQPGETFKTSHRGHVHVFPFDVENPEGPPRTHEGILQDANTALNENKVINGIKGPTFLQRLKYYDLAAGVCIDYMHGVLLGVTKLLLTLWFSTEKSTEIFSVHKSVEFVDKRLTDIKPPNSISRVPRSIKEHLKHWKASELRSWLLYYSAPVLQDVLAVEYYQHFLLFVHAVYILLQDSISTSDLSNANELLQHFCCLFAALYGERYMTCNIHQLLHLSRMVYDMGPLWAYSCFPFENANGVLMKLYHGTQCIDQQIAKTVSIMQYIPYLEIKHIKDDTPEMDFIRELKGIPKRNDKHLQEDVYVVGATNRKRLQQGEIDCLIAYLGHFPFTYISFNRIRVGNEIFHSKRYKRCSARNSYTIAYRENDGSVEFGQIDFYMKLNTYCVKHVIMSSECGCPAQNVALVSTFTKIVDYNSHGLLDMVDAHGMRLEHIVALELVQNLKKIIPIQSIIYKCVLVELCDKSDIVFVCKMPNMCERD